MTTDIYGRVLFHSGEGIDHDDLNAAPARTLAVVWDQVIASMFPRQAVFGGSAMTDAFDATVFPYAMALSVAGAMPIQGTTNAKVKISRGTLLQGIAAADGTEAKLLAYTFDGTDEVTIAAGDATNPRVDLVQMKLEYVEDTSTARDFQDATTRALTSTLFDKRRRVQCTLSVKQGTPAASPTYPTLDAGYVAIAGIVVGATYAAAAGFTFDDAAGAVAVLHDQRMPLNVRTFGTHPTEFFYPDGGDYLLAGRIYVSRAAVTGAYDISMPLLACGNTGRLVEVDCTVDDAATLTSRLSRFNVNGGTWANLAGANVGGSGAAQASRRRGNPLSFQSLHSPVAGPTVQQNAAGIGPPIWTNGFRAPSTVYTGEFDTTFPVDSDFLVLRYVNATIASRFMKATFYVATGM